MLENNAVRDGPDAAPSPTGNSGKLRAVLVALGLVVLAVILSNLLALIPFLLQGFSAVLAGTLSATTIVAAYVVSESAYAGVAYGYARSYLPEGVSIRVPTARELGYVVLGLVGTLAVAQGISLLGTVLGIEMGGRADTGLMTKTPTVMLAMTVLAVLVIGPSEELLFRGVIQRRLGHAFQPVVAIVVTSLLFLPPHAIGYTGSVAGIALLSSIPFCVSLILGYAYERTGNLLVSILIHGCYDATLFGITYLSMIGVISA